MSNKKEINVDEILLKFYFLLKETKTASATIEAHNEIEAKNILKQVFNKSNFEGILDTKTEFEEILEDREIIIEQDCENCGTRLVGKTSLKQFQNFNVGKLVCPKCHFEMMPCDDCQRISECDKCLYKDSLQVNLLNDIESIEDDEENEVMNKLEPYIDLIKDDCTLEIPVYKITEKEDNIYKRAYKVLCKKGITPWFANDSENDSFRYASYYILPNDIRIYCEWLIPSRFFDKKEAKEEFEFDPKIFTPETINYFTIEYNNEN